MNAQLLTRSRIVPAGGYKSDPEAIDIFISDLAFHAQKPTNPASLARNYGKHINGGVAKRTYGSIRAVNDHTFEMGIDFNEQEVLSLLQKQNKSILRIYLPTQDLPVSMAPDALEKLKSLKKQHLRQVNRK